MTAHFRMSMRLQFNQVLATTGNLDGVQKNKTPISLDPASAIGVFSVSMLSIA